MNYPSAVRIVEVGPRDGLQNENVALQTSTKVEFINQLSAVGLNYIEAGSFVSPKWVPQMAGSDDVFAQITPVAGVTYAALTPNMQGLDRAIECSVKEVAVFAAASETFSQKNINCTIAQSLQRFKPVAEKAIDLGVTVRGYISCAFGCPYEGAVDKQLVVDVAQQLLAMGCYEVSLGDTIGVATAATTETQLLALLDNIPPHQLAVHMHDTYGQALANILLALQMGISVVDSSVAGLGGCPYAKGASGNVATEDVVYLLNGLGIEHGVDISKLINTGNYICNALNRPNGSRVARALS